MTLIWGFGSIALHFWKTLRTHDYFWSKIVLLNYLFTCKNIDQLQSNHFKLFSEPALLELGSDQLQRRKTSLNTELRNISGGRKRFLFSEVDFY